jgi:NADH-quinone oxidoreductase subunit N
VVVAAIAILTMTWANLAAVAEPSVKRMLAYSSVGHAGYIAVALVAESEQALLFYMLVYTLMVVGAFGCVALLRRRDGQEALSLNEWKGVGLRHPWFGAAFAVFMFGLAGFPPTAGFMGKLYIFRAALELGGAVGHNNGYVALVAIALLNSLVSIYYYLRVVVAMYTPGSAPHDEVHLRRDRIAGFAIAIAAVGTVVLGFFPEIVFSFLPS